MNPKKNIPLQLEDILRQSDDSCAREPIHTPGCIQPHGAMVILDARGRCLIAKSENIDTVFPGTNLHEMPAWLPDNVREACLKLSVEKTGEVFLIQDIGPIKQTEVHCFTASNCVIVEFEVHSGRETLRESQQHNLLLSRELSHIEQAHTVDELADFVTKVIAEISGYERVLVYQFQEDGHGEVIGEHISQEGVPSFLGLHFPSSDIPSQARHLYRMTRMRWMPTREYVPLQLTPNAFPDGKPFDLTLSAYRSVSSVHRFYQKNINTDGSMSISILVNDELWGLLICHHRKPWHPSLSVRLTLSAITKAFNFRLSELLTLENKTELEHNTQVYSNLLSKLVSSDSPLNAILYGELNIINLFTQVASAAIIREQPEGVAPEVEVLGQALATDDILALYAWLKAHVHEKVFHTANLSARFPPFAAHKASASGLLAITFNDIYPTVLLLFRAEVSSMVNWAGDPQKVVDAATKLNLPRRSFERWSEMKVGHSIPWRYWELEFAKKICATVDQSILHQRIKALDTEVHRFSQAMFQTQTALYHQDINLKYIWVYDVHQLHETSIIGLTDKELYKDAPDLVEKVVDLKKRVLQTGHGARTTLADKPQDPVNAQWYDFSIHPLEGPHKEMIGLSSAVTNITDLKRAELKLQQQAQDLDRSNRELEQFAYVASHDLQEPLRMVASFTQLLERKYKDNIDETAHEYIDFIVDGATRMQVLIDDLLMFSKNGNKDALRGQVDLIKVCQQILQDIHLQVDESKAVINIGALTVLDANETQMRRLFLNLIMNGIKYHSEKAPVITIACEKTGAHEWHFTVADNGIGIEEQYFDKLFILFKRLHSRKEYAGTGIGLALCKKIVENYKGRIWIESVLGQGTTFHFTLKEGE